MNGITNAEYFDLGVICGRFGHMHIGHQSLFDVGLCICKSLYIIVGSAQEKGTLRNPFSVESRIEVIRLAYADAFSDDKLYIGGLNDLKNEFNNTQSWGAYLKNHIEDKYGRFADIMIYGQEKQRTSWFSPEDLCKTAELIIPRTEIPISATTMRGFLCIGDKSSWQKYMPENDFPLYEKLREELLSVPVYQKIYNELGRTKDLDKFNHVYSRYELLYRKAKIAELQK